MAARKDQHKSARRGSRADSKPVLLAIPIRIAKK